MASRSDEAVWGALGAVLRDHGWDVATDARRLRGSLNDVLGADAGEHRAAVDAVVVAVEEGVVADLLAAGRERSEDALPALAARLGEWGLAPAPAAWAVRAWASHLPAVTAQEPDTESEESGAPSQEPTVLPPVTAARDGAVSLKPVLAATAAAGVTRAPWDAMAPGGAAGGTAHGPATGTRSRRSFVRMLAVSGAVAVLVAGGVVAAVALNRDGQEPASGERPTTTESAATEGSGATDDAPRAPAVGAGAVIAAPEVRVPEARRRLAMAARTGGVRVARLGQVESVGTGDDERSAPEGGRLLAFRLADWSCGSDSCRGWRRLGLRVDVDGTRQDLPGGDADTFVVALPTGSSGADLVLHADGLRQTISLTDARPGSGNIAVLARQGRVDRVGERFTMTERTSIAFDYGDRVTDTVPRAVTVSRAELTWFARDARPSSASRAFLEVKAHYTIPYGAGAGERYSFELREMSLVGADGKTYRARDLDDGPGIDPAFEVPAGLEGGTLVLGGGSYPATSEAGPFTRTLTSRSVRLRFG